MCGLVSHSCSMHALCLLVTSVSMAAASSSLLRWSETSLSRWTKTRAIVKVILKPVWDQGERVTSTDKQHQHKKDPCPRIKYETSQCSAKANTPTLSTRHWDTDYEAVHNTTHVPWTDNTSETTLTTFKLWSPSEASLSCLHKPKL